jgi:uncharacterized protein YcaQ
MGMRLSWATLLSHLHLLLRYSAGPPLAMDTITLSRIAARRFILGRQGLWPGRRWKGKRGVERAIRAMEYLQLDPLQVLVRSQDLALHSRVVDYSPGLWEEACYKERRFFDWGGWLAVRPMEELPHWRVVMRRERGNPHRRYGLGRSHRKTIEEMLAAVRAKGAVSNRDFAAHTRRRVDSYRGRKDSSVALYHLWLVGDLMTHHRERFERVYALAEDIAPAHLMNDSADSEADRFLIRKTIAFHGLYPLGGPTRGDIGNPNLSRVLRRPIPSSELRTIREKMLSEGEIIEVRMEGMVTPHYGLASDQRDLQEVAAGRAPNSWKPCDSTTLEEVTFLSPLDVVTARDRARALFNFDYKWEVYTPKAQRKFGYYALPVLWDDAMVARIDLKLDRPNNILVVNGLWFEDRRTASNPLFHEALARGMSRLARFVKASSIDARTVEQRAIRTLLESGADPRALSVAHPRGRVDVPR